eukprot:SAG31_NODE_27239_length_429_cov_0.930303_1_plen_48_part_01
MEVQSSSLSQQPLLSENVHPTRRYTREEPSERVPARAFGWASSTTMVN